MKKGLLVGGIAAFCIILIPLLMYTSYNNSEVRLRNQVVAQQKVNETVFDNTWKILQQQAGVANEHKNAFKDIYGDLMHGRYDNGGGEMMKWVQEHNPQFDGRLYQQLMTSIEAQRTIFTREQAKLIDLKREHDNLRQTIPSNLFVGSRAAVEIKVVTSDKTDQTFQTGQENNVDLFNN
jgi:hypothetical protein